MRKITLILVSALLFMSMKSDLPAYRLFNAKGKAVSYDELVKEALKADVILFGELHNNPIAHWMQLELAKSVYQQKKDMVLGAEMFESDNALIVSEYVQGKVNDRNFESEARLWPNYKTDYKPLLQFARDNKLPFIATNIPRRYAALVNREGFEGLDALSWEAKQLIAPLPIAYDPELPGYANMLKMMGDQGGAKSANLPKAQAIKDATMAYFILKNLTPGATFYHIHGTYHSDNYEGIMWYLKKANLSLRVLTIKTAEQDQVEKPNAENQDKADFLLLVPSSMTKTH